MKGNTVIKLAEGYCRRSADPLVMHSNCSSSLIRTKSGKNILVDTMTPWHGQQLIDALASHGLRPDDIHYLVCTHGHSDHVGNNNLFVQAERHIVGQSVNCADAYTEHDFGEPLPLVDGILVVATPGHTMECVSVVVPPSSADDADGSDQTTTVIVIAGDLFERREDIEDETIWLNAGSADEQTQRKNRWMMAKNATHIVPGHGPMFAVSKEMREKLHAQYIAQEHV